MTTPTEVPACIERDRLTSPWFPNTSRALLYAIVAAGVVFMFTSFNRLNHTDLWGHLNFGRWIAEHGSLPTSDPFAASPVNQPMLHSAWLSQLVGYEVQHTFGNEGLAFGHALLVTLTGCVVMLAVYRRGTSSAVVWTAGALVFVLGLPILGTIRPQLFGMLGAALVLLACSELKTKRHPLFWLPIVMALWANLHGSVLMGLAILGLFAIGFTYEIVREAEFNFGKALKDNRIPRIWLAVVLALFATCLNPHGPMLLVHTIFFGEHAALQYISEWRALSPNSLTGVLMIASSSGAGLLIKYSPRKWQAYEFLLLAFFGLLTLSAIRMLAWWALVCPWVIVPHIAACWSAYRQKNQHPAAAEDHPSSMNTLIALGFVFMICIVSPSTYSMLAGRARGPAENLVTDTPIYVADEVSRRQLEGTFAAPMDWADYLVWETNGQLKPLVYSHVHLTNKETWDEYVKVFSGDPSWLDRLQKSQTRFLVVNKKRNPELMKHVLMADRSGKGQVWIFYQDQKSMIAEIRRLKPAAKPAAEQPPAAATSATKTTGPANL
ncbi:hypothetical protein NA78x_002343 [Anatilimnocola sp. NA78]|uniref:hypothetical protein n=1 Tax=Anatilimnocola sp. NA78 TaxID=3415683 RepID=UPI003CE5AD49